MSEKLNEHGCCPVCGTKIEKEESYGPLERERSLINQLLNAELSPEAKESIRKVTESFDRERHIPLETLFRKLG